MTRALIRPGFILMGAVLVALANGRPVAQPAADVLERHAATTDTAPTTRATDRPQTQGYETHRAVSEVVKQFNAMTFAKGQKAGFLGIFSHTEPPFDLDDQFTSAEWLLRDNPLITGISLKIWWNHVHPEKNIVYWDKLERLIALVASHGKVINLSLIPGYHTPEWVYAEGVLKIGPIPFRNEARYAPVFWSGGYLKLLTADIQAIAQHYGDDPRVSSITIQGHNYQGEEMHGIPVTFLTPYGFSREMVVENWKYWIDTYGQLFPHKKLILVISQMYPGYPDLPFEIADYFVKTYQGRAILQTHQLHGRDESQLLSDTIVRQLSAYAPTSHELVGSFKEQPARQGTAEMTVYNFIRNGNPLYLQLWRRDSSDPHYAQALIAAMHMYEHLEVKAIKAQLQHERLYREHADWHPNMETPASKPIPPSQLLNPAPLPAVPQ
jgi:hypothetical protein